MSRLQWLNPQEARTWRGYMRMRALLDLQIARDLAQETGLSDADYTVLVVLSEAPDHRIRLMELADRMLWSRSRLTHHLDRMEQRGLVRRDHHPDNRRAIDAVLTTKGRRAIETAAPRHVASVRRHFIDLLSAPELEALADVSERVIEHLRSTVTDHGSDVRRQPTAHDQPRPA